MWTWKHYIPNYMSTDNGPATATMVLGEPWAEYPVANVINDDPYVPLKFDSDDTGSGHGYIKVEGVKNGVHKNFFAIINDNIPPETSMSLYVTDGIGTWYMFQADKRGWDKVFVREWTEHAEDDHDEWNLQMWYLGHNNPYEIGLMYMGKVSTFLAQPTLPYVKSMALGRDVSIAPGGAAYAYRQFDRWNWVLTWETSTVNMGGILRAVGWSYLEKGACWIMYDPVMGQKFVVRFKELPEIVSERSSDKGRLYQIEWHLEEVWRWAGA